MNRKPVKIIALVSLVVLLVAAWHVAEAGGRKKKKPVLPKAAAAAIKKAYPKATIKEIEREKEGIVLYEVELKQKGEEFEVELTADGQIVSVEKEITKKDLPKAVAITLARYAGDAKIKEIEKERIYAVVKLVKLKKPLVVYEAEFMQNGREVEIKIAENGKFLGKEIEDDDDDDEVEVSIDQVPAAVKATILKHAGKNKIHEIEKETRRGKTIYEAEWRENGKEVEIKVAADGKLLSKEREISIDQVPAAVKATILKHAGKNKIHEIEVETCKGKKTYEAEWKVGGKEIEIEVAPDGTLLSKKTEDDDDDD